LGDKEDQVSADQEVSVVEVVHDCENGRFRIIHEWMLDTGLAEAEPSQEGRVPRGEEGETAGAITVALVFDRQIDVHRFTSLSSGLDPDHPDPGVSLFF